MTALSHYVGSQIPSPESFVSHKADLAARRPAGRHRWARPRRRTASARLVKPVRQMT
jgi:hypothetical protein